MASFKDTFYNSKYSAGHINVYHGGSKWTHFTAEIRSPRKGRFHAGIGINSTTKYETAKKFAKGRNIVSILWIDKGIKLSNEVNIEVSKIIKFIKGYIPTRYRVPLIEDVKNNAKRRGRDTIEADVLNNLLVNYDIGGQSGLKLTKFLVEQGVDASLDTQSGGENWLIIHNPKVIKKVIHTKPSDIHVDDYMLPPIKQQML